MNSVQNADEPLQHYSYWRVFFLIVAALSFVLAIGLPVTGYTIINKFRQILFQQIIHDNDAIGDFFISYLQQTRGFYDDEEDWLTVVREFVNIYEIPNKGYVCLIDSQSQLQAYPNFAGSVPATFSVFPYNPEKNSFELDMPVSIPEMLDPNFPDEASGELHSLNGNQLVELQRVMIDGKPWLAGIHQYTMITQEPIQNLLPFIVGLGIALFLAIVIPFGFFTGYLIRQHEIVRNRHVSEIESVAKQLQETNIRLNEMQVEKNRLYARLSHDLRAPLSSVVSACSMVADGTYGNVNEKQFTAMQRVERNVNVLLSLIGGILNLSRVESGFMKVNAETVSIPNLIHDLRDNLLPSAESKGLSIDVQFPEGLPEILTDKDKLYLILQNIVSNAVKFTRQGGVFISAQVMNESAVCIAVKDTGPGIPAQEQAGIFQEFSRGLHEDDDAGVGLGLAITKELIDLLGGTITVESQEGKGSTFIITIPTEHPAKNTNAV